jgi:hypothetical protein
VSAVAWRGRRGREAWDGAAREALERWQDAVPEAARRSRSSRCFPFSCSVRTHRADRPSSWPPPWSFRRSWCCRMRGAGRACVHGLRRRASPPPADRPRLLAMLDRIARMQGHGNRVFRSGNRRLDRVERRIGTGNRARRAGRMRPTPARGAARRRSGRRPRPGEFGVVLHPIAAARLGIRDAIADRLRAGLAAPILVGDTSLRLTASVGHAALGCGSPTDAKRTLAGATRAAEEAKIAGPGFRPGPCAGAGRATHAIAPDRRGPFALASGAITRGSSRRSTPEPARSRASRRWRAGPSVARPAGPDRFLGRRWNMPAEWRNLGARIRQQAMEALRAWDAAGHRR